MRVNEIFYSLQGEGWFAGMAAVFVRFSGCNLKCPFCDTDFKSYTEMTEKEIADEIAKYPAELVVITGGEPALQLTESLVEKIHALEKSVAVETNGTKPLPDNVDWVTLSPKEPFVGASGAITLKRADEVKIVCNGDDAELEKLIGIANSIDCWHMYIQPCDTGDAAKNQKVAEYCVDYVKKHPKWKLSLQTQKILKIR